MSSNRQHSLCLRSHDCRLMVFNFLLPENIFLSITTAGKSSGPESNVQEQMLTSFNEGMPCALCLGNDRTTVSSSLNTHELKYMDLRECM